MPITFLVVDDQALVRAGVCRLLKDYKDFLLVGEAAAGLEAIELAEQLNPDVILLDLSMPDLSGPDTALRLVERGNKARIIMLSSHISEHWIARALAAGVRGYVTKSESPDTLAEAIRSVHEGRIWAPADIQSSLFRGDTNALRTPLDKLSSRQRTVLKMVAEGHTSKEIAAALGISWRTVEAHRSEIAKRLHICDLAGLVRFAYRHQLVDADGDCTSSAEVRPFSAVSKRYF